MPVATLAATLIKKKWIKHISHLLSGHGAPPSMVEQKAALFGSVVPLRSGLAAELSPSKSISKYRVFPVDWRNARRTFTIRKYDIIIFQMSLSSRVVVP